MSAKITVAKPLVILHGDEMAQIAFERILDQFVRKRLDIDLLEIDLSAENRLTSNGQVVVDAIAALPIYDFNSPVNALPLRDYTQADFDALVPIDETNLVIVTAIIVSDSTVDSAAGLNPPLNTPSPPPPPANTGGGGGGGGSFGLFGLFALLILSRFRRD